MNKEDKARYEQLHMEINELQAKIDEKRYEQAAIIAGEKNYEGKCIEFECSYMKVERQVNSAGDVALFGPCIEFDTYPLDDSDATIPTEVHFYEDRTMYFDPYMFEEITVVEGDMFKRLVKLAQDTIKEKFKD